MANHIPSTDAPPTEPGVATETRLQPLRQDRRGIDWLIALGVFVISLFVYNATLTPSLSYLSPDGNELATVPYILGLAHSTGYPLYTWLGKLFTFIPIGDVAHRVNLMSATMGAGAVALLYGILLMLLKRLEFGPWLHRVVSASTVLFFAFSPSFWSQTGIAEVYAPNAFMVGLQLLLLLAWGHAEQANLESRERAPSGRSLVWFGAFCLAFALSTGTHLSNLGFGLGYLVFVLAVNWRFAFKPQALAVGIAGFAVGMLQHLWLPYKASTLTDSLMRRNMPNTWEGFYNYTLGAFPNFKFAFTWVQVPDRIVIYLDLLRQQFTLVGVLLGIVGMWVLVLKAPKRWWLLGLMYLVHLIFFTQYAVFDLDVFFIPAHLLFALFVGVGLGWLLAKIPVPRPGATAYRVGSTLGLAALIAFPAAWQLVSHWQSNDRSGDVAINDFYINVFDVLPQDAVLLGGSGVFGYDLFYWRLVYDLRPDVLIPSLPQAEAQPRDLAGRAIYSTMRSGGVGGGRGGPGGVQPGIMPADAWYVPILLGNNTEGGVMPGGRHELVLYVVRDTPPELIVGQARPQNRVGTPLGSLFLVGYDLDTAEASPGGRLHLTLYWRAGVDSSGRVVTALGDTILESHTLGFGNLARYAESYRPAQGGILVEDYWVVIPSPLEAGRWPLIISVGESGFEAGTVDVQWN